MAENNVYVSIRSLHRRRHRTALASASARPPSEIFNSWRSANCDIPLRCLIAQLAAARLIRLDYSVGVRHLAFFELAGSPIPRPAC